MDYLEFLGFILILFSLTNYTSGEFQLKSTIQNETTKGVWYLGEELTVSCSYNSLDKYVYLHLYQKFMNSDRVKLDGVVYLVDYDQMRFTDIDNIMDFKIEPNVNFREPVTTFICSTKSNNIIYELKENFQTTTLPMRKNIDCYHSGLAENDMQCSFDDNGTIIIPMNSTTDLTFKVNFTNVFPNVTFICKVDNKSINFLMNKKLNLNDTHDYDLEIKVKANKSTIPVLIRVLSAYNNATLANYSNKFTVHAIPKTHIKVHAKFALINSPNYTIECIVSHDIPAVQFNTLIWFHNNSIIKEEDSKFKLSGVKLHLLNLTNAHNGDYNCQVHNEIGKSPINELYIKIIIKPNISIIIPYVMNYKSIGEQRKNKPARLQCIFYDTYPPLYKETRWYKNGVLIATNNVNRYLLRRATDRNNIGTWTCSKSSEVYTVVSEPVLFNIHC